MTTETEVLELKMYINGEWRISSNRVNKVINPATRELIARAPEQQMRKQKKQSKRQKQHLKVAFGQI